MVVLLWKEFVHIYDKFALISYLLSKINIKKYEENRVAQNVICKENGDRDRRRKGTKRKKANIYIQKGRKRQKSRQIKKAILKMER